MKKFIGDRAFYAMVLAIVVPIIIQNGFTNLVNLLDNLMIGRVGTLEMSGVSIVNQLLFVFNLTVFGAMGAPGIYCAQYRGKNDDEGIRYCFRYKLYVAAAILVVTFLLLLSKGDFLIGLYLKGNGNTAAEISATSQFARQYLDIMMLGLPAFALSCVYSFTLKECGETKLPMIASVVAVTTNAVLNAILIFGLLGFPKLGVRGAAIATVISRYVELFMIVFTAHKKREQYPYIQRLYRSFYIPSDLFRTITIKGTPLLANEILWSSGMAILSQCYSSFGIQSVASMNINNTISQFFMVVCFAMGNAISIVVGQQLGSGDIEKAKESDTRLIFLSFTSSCVIGLILILIAPLIVSIYNVEPEVLTEASSLMRIFGLMMPVSAIYHSSYFTIRCGGNTLITFLSDSFYMWVISIPIARLLIAFTSFNLITVYFLILCLDLIKALLGLWLVAKGTWARNLIPDETI